MYNHSGKNLAASYEMKNIHYYLFNKNKSTYSQKDLYRYVHMQLYAQQHIAVCTITITIKKIEKQKNASQQ